MRFNLIQLSAKFSDEISDHLSPPLIGDWIVLQNNHSLFKITRLSRSHDSCWWLICLFPSRCLEYNLLVVDGASSRSRARRDEEEWAIVCRVLTREFGSTPVIAFAWMFVSHPLPLFRGLFACIASISAKNSKGIYPIIFERGYNTICECMYVNAADL